MCRAARWSSRRSRSRRRGRSATRRQRLPRSSRRAPATLSAARDAHGVLRRRLARHAILRRATACGPAMTSTGPAVDLRTQHHHGHRARLARDAHRRAITWCSRRPAPRRPRSRFDARRSGAARGLQQSLHGHRRTDGRDAGQYRQLGEHQGAPGFLLRAVRRAGQLIANAPHMPVHLGSMGESVQEILRRRGGAMQPGDAFALNAPYAGGTHLPDVTVVMPVFLGQAQRLSSSWPRAAITPTSAASRPVPCPRIRRNIDEEGVLLDNVPSSTAAFSSKTRCASCLPAARTRRATSRRTSRTCARRWPPARKASPSCRP